MNTVIESQQLLDRINKIVKNVKDRGVYVVVPEDNYFIVVDYIKKTRVITAIPVKKVADTICSSLNKSKRNASQLKTLQENVNLYSKHFLDCVYYEHVMIDTDDGIKREILRTRIQESQLQLKNIFQCLKRF